MIKLLLSDMDGTLLPFGATTVSQRTHEAILAAQQAGIHFGPASGRDRAALLPAFYGDQRCVSTGIMANGKQVFLNGELILRRSLPQDAIMRLGEALLPFEGSFALANVVSEDPFSPTTSYALGVAAGDEAARANIASARQAITPADELPADGAVISAGIYVDTRLNAVDDLRRIAESTCPDLAFPQPSPFFLDVIERGWTKASALSALLDAMGVTPEEVAYFGDSENDLTMLEAVPNSYAVANASPEARDAARQHIGPCEEDAVAQFIEDLLA